MCVVEQDMPRVIEKPPTHPPTINIHKLSCLTNWGEMIQLQLSLARLMPFSFLSTLCVVYIPIACLAYTYALAMKDVQNKHRR